MMSRVPWNSSDPERTESSVTKVPPNPGWELPKGLGRGGFQDGGSLWPFTGRGPLAMTRSDSPSSSGGFSNEAHVDPGTVTIAPWLVRAQANAKCDIDIAIFPSMIE
jgi:hypothetical protein